MPGPSNYHRKRKLNGKPAKKLSKTCSALPGKKEAPHKLSSSACVPLIIDVPAEVKYQATHMIDEEGVGGSRIDSPKRREPQLALETPFIYDPGNGPRVRDVKTFLSSKFFAQPPNHNDPLCAEFAQIEVLEMLKTILPDEFALILWYNKSRETSRICPTCQRLYRIGDILADHVPGSGDKPIEGMGSSERLHNEQILSGLCSPVCFIAAAYSYPTVIKAAWGRTEEEFDDETWNILNGPPQDTVGDPGLTMLMRMTRLHDLGLAQLCLGLDDDDIDVILEELSLI